MTHRSEGPAFSTCISDAVDAAAAVRPSYPPQHKPGRNATRHAVCHGTRPPPARRRSHSSQQEQSSGYRCRVATEPWLTLRSLLVAVLFSVLFCCQGASAAHVHGATYEMAQMEGIGNLLYDTREPPTPRARLARRAESSVVPSAAASTGSTTDAGTASSTASSTIETATPSSAAALPMPFDTSLGNNFTSPSCPTFFHDFLNNSTFVSCLPFSLLLQVCCLTDELSLVTFADTIKTSSAFFTVSRSPAQLTQTLGATCDVNFDQCSALMSSLATQIQTDNNCGEDLQLRNPVVLQAYNGFLAYQPLYHAGCLTDSLGAYCFSNAITNASAPTSSYIYYLPLAVQLPAGTQPACNTCLQNTMAIFATAAGNSTQPLNGDYTSAAQMVDETCGPTFVDSSVARTSAAFGARQPGVIGLVTLIAILLATYC